MLQNEDENTRDLRIRLVKSFQNLATTTTKKIIKSVRLMKSNANLRNQEMPRTNKVIEKQVKRNGNMCRVIDAVHAMTRTIKEIFGMKRERENEKKEHNKGEHRTIRKLQAKLKDLIKQAVATIAS